MAEPKDNGAAAATETKTPGVITSAGKPTSATFVIPEIKETSDKPELETPEAKTARETLELAEKNKLPELNDEQLAKLLEGKGIKLDDKGFEGLAEKLKPVTEKREPTAEEKLAAEKAFDQRMLNKFIESGGTAESFVAFQQIAKADLTELSVSELKRGMKEKGFNDDEIAEMVKERYYQVKLDELEQDIEGGETDAAFAERKAKLEKKITYGTERLGTYGSSIQKQALSALETLKEAIQFEDLQKEQEDKHSNGVETFFSKVPRKVTFELGDAGDGTKIAPIEYEITDAVIAEIKELLIDKDKRNNFLYNKDNSLNLDNIATVMLRNKYLESALKEAYIKGDETGGNREVDKFRKIFPGVSAKDVGVGGASGGGDGKGRKGHLVSASKPQAGSLQHN